MNYIELIKRFWQCNEEQPIGSNATALYFYLLKVCNSLGWKVQFRHSDRYISIQLGISVNTVRGAKNRLKQLGLIDFKSPDKKSKGLEGSTIYTFSTVSMSDTVPDTDADTVIDTVHDTVPNTDADTRNKLNKTKLTNIPPIPPKKGESVKFSFDFVEDEFREPFENWLEYKKQRRESYKTQKSLEACYRNLKELSNQSPYTASKVVEQSLSNNWAGLFELKNNRNEANRRNNKNSGIDEEFARNIAEGIARADYEKRQQL